MKRFQANLSGCEIGFEAEIKSANQVSLVRDDRSKSFDVVTINDTQFSVMDSLQRSYNVELCRRGDFWQVYVDGKEISLSLLDERALRRQLANPALKTGSGKVVSPMPGKVVDVKVKAGDVVKIGQGVVVVEAMKMQNEFKSEIDGVVTSVSVKAGDSVEGGTVLLAIEAA